jgi:hypothetical protein
MPKCRLIAVRNPVALVGLLTCAVSFVAQAEEAKASAPVAAQPTASAQTEVKAPPQRAFYSGSAIAYGHAVNPGGFGEPGYEYAYANPAYTHHLEIVPEFHVGSQFFVRGKLALEQEFTDEDGATSPEQNHRVYLGDIGLETGVAGYTIPVVGIHLSGNLRFTAPTSLVSQAQTMVLSVGPALALSRKFDLLSGLSVSYAGRWTHKFHQYTQGTTNAGGTRSCLSTRSEECKETAAAPLGGAYTNVHDTLTHGPALAFSPVDILTFATTFQINHRWRYEPTHVDGIPDQVQPNGLFDTTFDINASIQIFKPVGLTLGASTFTPGKNPEGSNLFVLFNRNTTLYLDATVDIEAAVKGILGDKS